MSADLFAEFDDFSQPQQTRQGPTPSTQTSELPDPFSFSSAAPTISSTQQTQPWPSFQDTASGDPWGEFSGASSAGAASKPTVDDDDDGWGDFETAQTAPKPTTQTRLQQAPITSRNDTSTSLRQAPQKRPPQRTRILRAPTIELMTNSLIDIPGANALPEDARSPPWLRKSVGQQAKETVKAAPQQPFRKTAEINPNMLFDADDFDGQNIEEEEDDDEFGDFETVAPAAAAPRDIMSDDLFTPPATAKRTPAELLSSLNLHDARSEYPKALKSPSFQDRNPFPGLALNTPTKSEIFEAANREPSPDTAWPSLDQQDSGGSNKLEDDWGAFGSFPAGSKSSKQDKPSDDWDWDSFDTQKTQESSSAKPAASNTVPKGSDASWAWDAGQTTNVISSQSDEDKSPPINVPPPSVLLSIFPEVLGQANESLYKPVGGQPFSIKNRILADPKTVDFLRGYLLLATVAARVIAGRKLRWHRDKFLSQGMSISVAGSKGMKLAGVDKTQSIREDREAVDVLDIWKEHVGRLRSSVASANSVIKNSSEHLKIPDLRENMQAQTAKAVLTAPKACVICGLKRDERIARVDFEVEDSFGEWWTEHWGHTACKRFWLQHQNALRTRQ